MSKQTRPADAREAEDRRRSRFTGPLHIQVGDTRITIQPGGEVVVTPALTAALGDLVEGLEPIVGPAETPAGSPTEEA